MSTARLVWRMTKMNVRARLEYRTEFLMELLHGILWQASTVAFLGVVVTRFPGLGGWTSGQVVFIAGLRLIGHALYVGVFSNLTFVPQLVREGRIDAYLLRPRPLLTQVLITWAHPTALGDLAVGATLLGAGIVLTDVDWTAWRVAFLLAAIVGAMLLEAAFQLFVTSLAFRYVDTFTLSAWVDEMGATFGNYPTTVFPQALRVVFLTVIPTAYLAFLPSAVLMGQELDSAVVSALAHASPLVSLFVFVLARRVWYAAASSYQGAQ